MSKKKIITLFSELDCGRKFNATRKDDRFIYTKIWPITHVTGMVSNCFYVSDRGHFFPHNFEDNEEVTAID
jgi:hypothetical protein